MSITVSLEGKTAIVAGGGRGIGARVAGYLAEAGARVAVVDKLRARAEETAHAITSAGGQAVPVVADLLVRSDVDAIVENVVDEFGQVDVQVNVAGGAWAHVPYRRMHDMTDEDWNLVFGLNLGYVFWLSRAVVRSMLAKNIRGSIVNIGSIAGVFSSPNSSSYGAAKAGLISFTRTLAQEYGRDGIRINTVCPGRIETPAASAASLSRAGNAEYQETIPMGYVGEPLDIAKAVLFFASGLSSYVTGQTILVDGGASTTPAIMPSGSPQRVPSDQIRGIA